jgi:hypothetical protein
MHHLLGVKTEREEPIPCIAVAWRDAHVNTGSVSFFEFSRIVIQLLQGMGQRSALQNPGFIVSRKREIKSQMRDH